MLTTIIRLTDQRGRDVLIRTDAFVAALPYEGDQAEAPEGQTLDPVQTVLLMDSGASIYVTQPAQVIERMRVAALREMARLS